MRIAVLTDAHANLPALQAALRAITQAGCDAIYHTGDAIGIGPYPAECLDLLLSTPRAQLIMGNHDAWFADGLPQAPSAQISARELEHQRWVHAQLDAGLRPVVAAWPFVLHEIFDGLGVTFLHYALSASGRGFAPIIPDPRPSDLDALFAGDSAQIVFYGHHHPASDLTGRARYVNPGSLGCYREPLARFALLTTRRAGAYTLEQRAVPYDDTALFQELERRAVPERDFIRRVFLPRPAG